MAARKDDRDPKAQAAPAPKKDREKDVERADDGTVEVALSAEEDEEEDDSGEPAPRRESRSSRRYREMEEQSRRAQEEARAAAERAVAAERRAAELEAGRLQQQQSSDMDEELKRITQQRNNLAGLIEGRRRADGSFNATQEELADWDRQANELTDREWLARERKFRGGNQPVNPQQAAAIAHQQSLMSRYGDVMQNPQALLWARGQIAVRASRGERESWEMYDELATEARRLFQIGGGNGHSQQRRPPPDDATKRRFSGMPANGRGTAGGGDDPGSLRLTKEQQSMATALYPKLKPAEAYQKWANGPGKRAYAAAQRAKTG